MTPVALKFCILSLFPDRIDRDSRFEQRCRRTTASPFIGCSFFPLGRVCVPFVISPHPTHPLPHSSAAGHGVGPGHEPPASLPLRQDAGLADQHAQQADAHGGAYREAPRVVEQGGGPERGHGHQNRQPVRCVVEISDLGAGKVNIHVYDCTVRWYEKREKKLLVYCFNHRIGMTSRTPLDWRV